MNNDAYGHTVSMTTDGTNDYYLVGGSITYTFPAGTAQNVVYLSIAKQFNLTTFMAAITSYIQTFFPPQSQIQFIGTYLAALAASMPNRAAYCAQLLTWITAIEGYAATYVATINAMTDPSVVAATVIDFTQIPATPNVTLVGAISIPN